MTKIKINSLEEVWQAVPGFELLYEVSNTGKVRSVDAYVNGRYRLNEVFRKGRILKPKIGKPGYEEICLRKNSTAKFVRVHCLVAEVFIGPRPHKYVINHKDGNKTNNRVDNLEYCTYGENHKHAHSTGLRTHKKRHINYSATDEQIHQTRKLRNKGLTYPAIAERVNLSVSVVGKIVRGELYAWVS